MARTPNLSRNLNAFLDMIAVAEGTSTNENTNDDGYDVIVGGWILTSYADHPRKKVWFSRWKLWSTGAGRYQVLAKYYDHYKVQLRLPDFSPLSQDRIAIQLIKECKALPAIERGNFALAVKRCNSRWASLPGAGYGQHEQKITFLADAYQEAGGTLSHNWEETA